MEEDVTYYTVLCGHKGYPVKYSQPPLYRIETFIKQQDHPDFDDPAEACGEFEACIGGEESCYLEPQPFYAKVRALRQWQRSWGNKLAAWNAVVAGSSSKENES